MQKSLKPFPPKDAPGLVGALRSATADLHQAVERLPVMTRLTAAAADLADYRRYLGAMALVYGGLEPGLFAALTAGLSRQGVVALGVRPKYPALCADLEVNGLSVPAKVPVVVVTPADGTPGSLGTALGGLYVLEGATLGGRLIVRQLRRQFGGQLIGASFLDFHGDQAAASWKGFSRALEGLAMAQFVMSEQSIAGARAVFGQVYRILAEVDMSPCEA